MHELSLVSQLVRKVEAIAQEHHAPKVVAVSVRLGALSSISADHLREHFVHAAQGTLAEGARLDVEALADTGDPLAQEVFLVSIEMEIEAAPGFRV